MGRRLRGSLATTWRRGGVARGDAAPRDSPVRPRQSRDAAPHLPRARAAAVAPSRCRSGPVPAPAPWGGRAPAGIPAPEPGRGASTGGTARPDLRHPARQPHGHGAPRPSQRVPPLGVCAKLSPCLRMASRDCGSKWSKWVKPGLPYVVSEQAVCSGLVFLVFSGRVLSNNVLDILNSEDKTFNKEKDSGKIAPRIRVMCLGNVCSQPRMPVVSRFPRGWMLYP